MTKAPRIDVAHSARVYDYWLGGKDNFGPDRALGDVIKQAVPAVPMMVRANRTFMLRATRYLAAQAGIRQFLDIGTGIPTRPNLHEVAQHIAPDARVVYVDNDPLVLVHARALLTSTPQGRCSYLDADLRDPASILRSDEVTGTLDLTRPVAVTFGSILMLLHDDSDPWATVRHLMDAMPAGSYLVVSHPTGDMNAAAMAQVAAVSANAGMTFVPRARAEVARFFDGYDMVDPGLVPVLAWRPDDSPAEDPYAAYYWAGVART
ncbi:SAM-dependent methyltransferase [Micromonosporaceae bacterium Da 78-11]